jgi:hypothetical protein
MKRAKHIVFDDRNVMPTGNGYDLNSAGFWQD